jgi:hypothetical protein
MANPFESLAPEGFHKIAQNDDRNGDVLSVVYLNNRAGKFFVQIMDVNKEQIALGPFPAFTFYNLCQILGDVKDMERKYHFID